MEGTVLSSVLQNETSIAMDCKSVKLWYTDKPGTDFLSTCLKGLAQMESLFITVAKLHKGSEDARSSETKTSSYS